MTAPLLGSKMDLASIQEAFDRVAKKQKVSYTKTQDVIEKTLQVVEAAAKQLNEAAEWSPEARKAVLTELQTRLTDIAPTSQV